MLTLEEVQVQMGKKHLHMHANHWYSVTVNYHLDSYLGEHFGQIEAILKMKPVDHNIQGLLKHGQMFIFILHMGTCWR